MLGKVIAISHFCTILFISLYIFIVPKKFIYDFWYTIFNIFLQMHWILLKHECIFSYIYKATHYPNYYMGKTRDLDDFSEIFDMTTSHSGTVTTILSLVYIVSAYIASVRSKIVSPLMSFIFLIFIKYVYLFYNNQYGARLDKILPYIIGKKNFSHLEKIYYRYNLDKLKNEINCGLFTILFIFTGYVFYKNKNRL